MICHHVGHVAVVISCVGSEFIIYRVGHVGYVAVVISCHVGHVGGQVGH